MTTRTINGTQRSVVFAFFLALSASSDARGYNVR
jgi:hypothetical protein